MEHTNNIIIYSSWTLWETDELLLQLFYDNLNIYIYKCLMLDVNMRKMIFQINLSWIILVVKAKIRF